MKKSLSITILAALMFVGIFNSCKKTSNEIRNIYVPPVVVAHPVAPGDICGTISGTMTTGNTYNVICDITINAGDTLWLQPGVTVCVKNKSTIIVKGALISLGTQAQPNWFTVCDVSKINSVSQSESQATDPAWNNGQGWWTGINCDTSCTLLVLKWTHVEFTGASFPITENFVGGTQGATSKGILFQNPNGDFIMEDSWMYGSIDDAIRLSSGHCSIMRNTFEKAGYVGGDCVNIKSGSVGDVAYNLFIGTATNGSKASNKGGISPQCNINMYNNTYVDGGYRQASTGRGANINYEQGARGMIYNNLVVNCKYGIRVVFSPIADTANMSYGFNYIYCDSIAEMEQIYPTGYITRPECYVVPIPSHTGYIYNPSGAVAYNDDSLTGRNNPMFVNFPLPEAGITNLFDINYVTPGTLPPFTSTNGSSFDFHLQSGSPALGIGTTAFSPLNVISSGVKATSYAPIVTPPNKDMGCYPIDGSGNQH